MGIRYILVCKVKSLNLNLFENNVNTFKMLLMFIRLYYEMIWGLLKLTLVYHR